MHKIYKIWPYVLIMGVIAALLSLSPINDPAYLGEYGLFEILQIVMLGVATILWLFFGPWHVSLNILGASMTLVFMGREASWMEVYGGSEALVETLKLAHIALLSVTVAVLAVFWLRGPARHAQLFRKALRSDEMVWVGLGFVVLLISDIFEKKFLPIQSNLFWEECLELIAYTCIVIPIVTRRLSPSADPA